MIEHHFTEQPDGQSIADKIKTLNANDRFSDVANNLQMAHAHRPGKFHQDLQAVNESLHHQGILPGINIVGVQGRDFLTVDATGQAEIYDSRNLSRHKSTDFGLSTDFKLNNLKLNADGTSTYGVAAGDSDWKIAKTILKIHGEDNADSNHIANYVKELEQANGRNLGLLHAGDQLNIPVFSSTGDQTAFGDEPAPPMVQNSSPELKPAVPTGLDGQTAAPALLTPPSDGAAVTPVVPTDDRTDSASPPPVRTDDRANVASTAPATASDGNVSSQPNPESNPVAAADSNSLSAVVSLEHDEAVAAQKKFAGYAEPIGFMGATGYGDMTRADVEQALKNAQNVTDADRRGLNFIQNNFDALQQTDGFWTTNNVVYIKGIDDWAAKQMQIINSKQ